MMREMSQAIQERTDRIELRKSFLSLLLRVLVITLVAYIALGHVFMVNQAKGMDMFPAVKDGDLFIAFRLHRHFEKNDVLVYENDGVKRIGRVIARENDVVSIDEDGTVRVNGTLQSGEIMYPTFPTDSIEYPYQVPKDELFVLGDFRTQSLDSRDLGAISKDKVKGKLITILRRQGI